MKFLAIAAGLVASVSAYTYPTPFNPTASGANPSGNPIYTPNTGSPVTLGEPYYITWDPTTPGPIALVLCKGPSTDCEPMMTIADKVANSGKYVWTPTDLTPSATSSGGYGIMLIDWTTEAYQYTTQFGVLAGAVSSSAAASSSTPTSSATPASSSTPASTTTVTILPSSSAVVKPTSTSTSSSASSPSSSTIVDYYVSTTVICPESTKLPLGTGTVSVPWVTSTGSPSVPTSVPSTVPAAPKYTGAADRNMVSFGTVGAIAGLAALLAF